MEITTLTVSMFATNCFLVYDKASEDGVIIDPGDEGGRIIAEIDNLGFTPQFILLTHGHGDHIGAVEEIKTKYDIPLYAGKGAEVMIEASNENFGTMYGVEMSCPPPDRLLAEGDEITIGSEKLKVLATPGHSRGSVCFHSGNIVFCGDTLFLNSIGRTDLPGGNHEQLISMIKEKLLALPDDTICYPGHGPDTTIGHESRNNPFLTGRLF